MKTDNESAKITLVVNENEFCVDPKAHSSLLGFLRNELRLTGTKQGCSMGNCGACSVLIDGVAVQSCQIGLVAAAGTQVKTVESIVQTRLGSKIANTLTHHDAAQCGYCLPGIVVAAYGGFLDVEKPNPVDILQRNICRCGTQFRILAALRDVIDEVGNSK